LFLRAHWVGSQAATQAELAEAQTQRDKWQRQAESAAAQLSEARDEVAHHSEELVQLQVPRLY
jgi:chromosome segregation ATPase